MLYLFSENSAEFTSERKALPVGCINIFIFHMLAQCYISKVDIGENKGRQQIGKGYPSVSCQVIS